MIPFIIYLLIILSLIYKNDFFDLFKDSVVSSKKFTLLFLLKIIAVPVFYIVYKKLYGGVEKFDSGKFYTDASIINDYAKTDFIGYIKLLFGFQTESAGTALYDNFIVNTTQWDNGRLKDYFYNDNRIIIRIHSLIHFIAFKSYFVHALFSCFFSFIGIVLLYKSIKQFFIGKEIFVLLILCFLPALWFYTGALLKEGWAVFFLGNLVWSINQFFLKKSDLKKFVWLCFLIFISILLKPYLLFFSFIFFSLFFLILNSHKIKYKSGVLFFGLTFIVLAINVFSIIFKKHSLFEVAISHQRVFADASKGGIFLLDDYKFVRLEFDSTLIKPTPNKAEYYNIKKGVSYIYWEHSHQQDTLICSGNVDTLTNFKLVYKLPKSGSNIELDLHSKNIIYLGISYLYYGLLHPLFFNSKSLLQQLASVENLFILISLVVFLVGLIQNKKSNFPAVAFVTFAVLMCFLIGITTPNSGAIFRYRSPAVVFIMLAALYYLPLSKNTIKPTSN